MRNNPGLIAYLSVRKIIALTLTGTFCYLAFSGLVTKDEFIPIFSMIIGYYFGKSTALDVPVQYEDHSHSYEKDYRNDYEGNGRR